MSHRRQRGMTLIELLVALALAAMLALAFGSLWWTQMIRMRQQEAKQALLHNARFLERHFGQFGFYRNPRQNPATARAWPRLPVTSTGYYLIAFTTVEEHTPGRYRLQARPSNEHRWLGDTFLRMDQDGLVVTCRPQPRIGEGGEICTIE